MQANRLIKEKSPYLLQHAYNPVDWYPWGEEAFARAAAEDKPIFLSIGYSTCHWCHVMERESFEDAQVAEILNQHFVSIKVDREERPDIDSIYMAACQAMTGGHGGWPLTIIMTPKQQPFFAGTYFPKTGNHRMPGLIEILNQIRELWETKREEIQHLGRRVTKILKRKSFGRNRPLSVGILDQAYAHFFRSFDAQYGGLETLLNFLHAPEPALSFKILEIVRRKKSPGDGGKVSGRDVPGRHL